MRRIIPALALFLALSLGLTAPLHAASQESTKPAPARADTPRPLGTFGDWIAATHHEADQTVCYAFTRARSSSSKIAGRGDVVLSVTERPSGRDAVALSAGFAYPANAEARLQVEKASFALYTAQHSAFARDGHAVVAALLKGHEVAIHSPAPRHLQVTDQFSLHGFAAAYAAINKACPAK